MVDRALIQVAELPCAEDFLFVNKAMLYGFANLISAAIGPNTGVAGFAISPTTIPSLQVIIGTGSIYAAETADATAYGVLGTDTNTIMKQGELNSPVTLTITPPATSGYSQYYVVQAAYNDLDTGATLAPFYNSLNPAAPSSATINTIRQGQAIIALKAGASAPAGSQVIPSPDVGYTPLYVILVANGQTAITSANWYVHPSAPYFPNLESLYSRFVPIIPATTWYVDIANGTDDVSHGVSSGTGAFKTIAFAINYICRFRSSASVTVNIAAGTYTAATGQTALNLNNPNISVFNIVGAGVASTLIDAGATGARGLVATNVTVNISNLKIRSYYESFCANSGSSVAVSNCNAELANTPSGINVGASAFVAYNGGVLFVEGSSTVTGNGNAVFVASAGGMVNFGYYDINSGALNYSVTYSSLTVTSVATASANSTISITGAGFSQTGTPTVTGNRYVATQGGGIYTGSNNANFFPGSGGSAGIPAPGVVGSTSGYYY